MDGWMDRLYRWIDYRLLHHFVYTFLLPEKICLTLKDIAFIMPAPACLEAVGALACKKVANNQLYWTYKIMQTSTPL